jgi:hypothetical protein
MATSKIVLGFLLAGTLAACGGEQTTAAVGPALPEDAARADAGPTRPAPAAAQPALSVVGAFRPSLAR